MLYVPGTVIIALQKRISLETVLNTAKHSIHVSYGISCTLEVLVKFLKRVICAKKTKINVNQAASLNHTGVVNGEVAH